MAMVLLSSVSPLRAENTFAGSWDTSFGPMTLTQEGNRVQGFYLYEGSRATLDGKVEKSRLTFKYEESDITGEGWFELAVDGQSFQGKWRETGTTEWGNWTGKRLATVPKNSKTFAGLWKTTYGSMRLSDNAGRIQGIYGSGGAHTVDGKLEGNKFVFRYNEEDVTGEGWFELSADGGSFQGQWRVQGATAWTNWKGERIAPTLGRVWLVVLEANWEQDLNDQEYSFGGMLRAFFARSSKAQVRHRFFTDADSLAKWCREIAYLPEPVYLVIATHGTPRGVQVSGKTIGAAKLADGLRHCGNLRLLHFSACLMMKDRLASEMVRSLEKHATFPISGYRTSVDWAASAIIEFMYLELILIRGKTPESAAEQVGKLLPFSGDKPIPGADLPPAGFRLLLPGKMEARP